MHLKTGATYDSLGESVHVFSVVTGSSYCSSELLSLVITFIDSNKLTAVSLHEIVGIHAYRS